MEMIIKTTTMRAGLVVSIPGRGCEGKAVKQQGSLVRSGNCSSFYHFPYCWEKPEVNYSMASIKVVTDCQRDNGRHITKADLTPIDTRYERPKAGKQGLKRTDLAVDHESVRITDYGGAQQSHNNIRVETTFTQAEISDAEKEDSKATIGSPSTWARLAGAKCALSPDEELSLSADVQDMLYLERQKDELGKELGRAPTVAEWAAHCGTSVFKIYARIGKGRAAKRKMISANLYLVNSVAEQFWGRGLSHWELCQEGVQGLLNCAEKYNTAYDTKFSTYSFLWIWQKMSAGVKNFRHVLRVSRTVYETSSILLRHKEEFQVMHGRPPSLQQLADVSQVDAETIRNVMRIVRPVKSMDEVVSTLEGDYEKQVEDQNAGCIPWSHIMELELRIEVAKALQCLASREQRVLEMRYGLCGEPPQGRAQVGLALGLTYESIRLIEKKALHNLRHVAKEDGLQQYLSKTLWSQ